MNDTIIDTGFNFDNSYAEQLEGFYVSLKGDKAPAPALVKLNQSLAALLGLDLVALKESDLAAMFSGGMTLKGASPLAQAYAGHQFGGFSPQLGDGRALLLAEVIDAQGDRYDIQLKGSGRTMFSRGGDGKAALAPVLREYLLGEAMFALGVPTTRALAAVTTGEQVYREGMLPGAVLARVASSHLRVGTFEYFAARGEADKVKQLADYTIQRHFPELKDAPARYLGLLRAVCEKQALLVANWMCLGFVHGVMNTDNVTISGETIDYGPCAFIDHYDPAAVFSSIDRQGRYAFGNQSSISQWNLARLAETLLPLIHSDQEESVRLATDEVIAFEARYQSFWLDGMRKKLGLSTIEERDHDLATALHTAMAGQNVDFTLLFRGLSALVPGYVAPGAVVQDKISAVPDKGDVEGKLSAVRDLFDDPQAFDQWYATWLERLARDSMTVDKRIASMNAVNPIYIPRNHKVEEALQAAEQDANYVLFEKLMQVLEKPFEQRDGLEDYVGPAPKEFGPYKTFCGT